MIIEILKPKILRNVVLAGIFILNFTIHAQTLKTSISDGNWTEIGWNPAGIPATVDDATINNSVTIPLGTTVEIQNLHLDSNAKLRVDGNLIVYGNVTMANNSPEFVMGSSAVVVVHGNFEASNQINISVSSYLIIYGSFIKDGSDTQGDFQADEGNIYIFGEVDDDWGMTSCEASYDGTTETTGDSECDYGQQEDFEENQDLIPDELKVLISCFKIPNIPDVTTCETGDAVFQVDQIENVSYEWQKKAPDGNWISTGDNTHLLQLTDVTAAMSGNQYRVVLRPTAENTGNCKVGFSNIAVLQVDTNNFSPGPITGETNICLPSSGELTYSVTDVGDNFSYDWILPTGWVFENPNASNSSSVSVLPDYSSGTKVVKVIVSNTCGQKESQLLISMAVPGEWTGYVSSDWNVPANWGCGLIPDLTTDVVIPDGLKNYPDTNSGPPAMANNLTIGGNAYLTVKDFELQIREGIFSSGRLDAVSGSITIAGSNQQEITSGTFELDRIKNLRLINPSGLVLSGPLEVTLSVIAEKGNIISNGNLKLISDATQTALIAGSGSGEVLGEVAMQRFLNNGFGYKYFSTPFKNTTVGDFSAFMKITDPVTDFPHFYTYDESRKTDGEDASGWVIHTVETNSLEIGRGYAVNFGKNSTSRLVELSGEVNNGPFDLTLQNNNGLYTKGFHLLGNPYPSPIDWTQVLRNNMEDAIYFFTASPSDQYTGVYSSVVGGVSSDGKSSTVIPSMQGFFVKVSEAATTGSVSFRNSARIIDFSQEFLKKPSAQNREFPIIRLQAGFKSNLKDPLVIYFPPNANAEFEADKDAQKLFNTDPNVPSFYSILENDQKLSINGLSISEEPIPLGIAAKRSGELNISLQNTENFTNESSLYLLDAFMGKMINLEKQSYTFKIKKGEHNDRFFLVVSPEKLSAAEVDLAVEPFSVYSNKGEIIVRLNLPENQLKEVKLISMAGQLLQKKTGKGKDEIRYEGIPAPGIYIVSLKRDNERITKKILLKK